MIGWSAGLEQLVGHHVVVLIVSVWPGCSLIVWLTAGLAPFRAQMWQPLVWWVITSVLPAAGAARRTP